MLCTGTYSFLDDVMLTISGQAKSTPVGRILKVTHQGAKSGVYDCLFNRLESITLVIQESVVHFMCPCSRWHINDVINKDRPITIGPVSK